MDKKPGCSFYHASLKPMKENQMKKAISLLIVMIVMTGVSSSVYAKDWETDFNFALDRAKKDTKYVLLNFSGSDWCGWCKKLDAEVFKKYEFKQYVKNNFVCVLLDFPFTKPQGEKLKQQNKELAIKYGIRGYPTILILSPTGELIAKTGYLAGGVKIYVEHLKRIIGAYEKK